MIFSAEHTEENIKEKLKIGLKNQQTAFPDSTAVVDMSYKPVYEHQNYSIQNNYVDSQRMLKPSMEPGDKTEPECMPGRKMVGIRYLFPHFPDHYTLLQKTKIWVARHDYGYFVGWNKDELERVDPVLRPNQEVTLALYKKNMNRSEYCRNVKLKYCLEANTPWAEEFRSKLSKSYSSGGFKGLCEVKQAAAELWRRHSERYRGNQARYPNPKSKYKTLRQGLARYDNLSVPMKKRRFSQPCFETELQPLMDTRSTTSSPGVVPNTSESLGDRRPNSEPSNMKTVREEDVTEYEGRDLIGNPRFSNMQHADHLAAQKQGTYNTMLDQTIEELCILDSKEESNNKNCILNILSEKEDDVSSEVIQLSPTSCDSGMDVNSSEANESQIGKFQLPGVFLKLPATMSIKEQLDIWLERHKNCYFANASSSDLENVSEILKPIKQITSENFDHFINKEFRNAVQTFSVLKVSNNLRAKRFMQLLDMRPEKGGFNCVLEALVECDLIQTKIEQDHGTLKPEYIDFYRNQSNRSYDKLADLWARQAREQLYYGQVMKTSRSHWSILPQSGNQSHFAADYSVSSDPNYRPTGCTYDYVKKYPTKEQYHQEQYHQLSTFSLKETHAVTHKRKEAQHKEVYNTKAAVGSGQYKDDKMQLVHTLWGYRHHLHNLCADDTKLSWKQKLEPFLPVLVKMEGDLYDIPNNTNYCIVDMVLAVLHSAIMDK